MGLALQASATNLMTNGDFEDGNTGFSSDYTYWPIGTSGDMDAGYYSVVSRANQIHGGFDGFPETGAHFFVANGAATIVGTGTTTITASQAGNENYEAATPVAQALTVQTVWDAWAAGHSLTGASRTHAADPDADGFSNAHEFAFGTNPNVPNFRLFDMTESGGELVVTFLWRIAVADAGYDIRSSTDLTAPFANGTGMTVYGVSDQSGLPSFDYERVSVRLPITGERGFIRMEANVLTQPSP